MRRLGQLAALALIALSAAPARSQETFPDTSRLEWKDITSVASYMRMDHGRCGNAVLKMLTGLARYGELAARSGARDQDAGARELLAELRKELDSPGNRPCRTELRTAYLLGSLFILHPGNTALDQPVARPDFRSPTVSVSAYSAPLVLLATALANRGKLEFLTPDLRQSRAERGSPLWTARSPRTPERYWLIGAYSCQDTRIHLDPTLPPLDLAGVLVHELQHFFRDHRPDRAGKTHRLLSLLQSTDPRERRADVLLDELSGIVQAGERQYSLKMLTTQLRKAASYVLGADLTMFLRDGPLVSFLDHYRDIPLPASDELSLPARTLDLPGYPRKSAQRIRETREAILKEVHAAYFPGIPYHFDESYLQAIGSTSFTDPLYAWRNLPRGNCKMEPFPKGQEMPDVIYADHGRAAGPLGNYHDEWLTCRTARQFFYEIDEVMSYAFAPSLRCQELARDPGDFNPYLGYDLEKGGPLVPQLPGADGVRGTLHPCVDFGAQ
jgi:hypothetical protein